MTDETNFTDKPADAGLPTQTTKTETTTTTEASGPPQPAESMIGGVSGRFKIVYALTIGAIFLPILYLIALIAGRTVDPTVFLSIYSAYLGVAAGASGTYIGGQAQKPKT